MIKGDNIGQSLKTISGIANAFSDFIIDIIKERRKRMEVVLMRKRVRPYKGKWCPRSVANEANDFFQRLKKPDRTALKKEAEEYEKYYIRNRLSQSAGI